MIFGQRIQFFSSLYENTFCNTKSVFSFSLKEETDEILIKHIQAGNDKAFDLLYERYFHKLYAFILRRVGHAQIAEDLLSDVFMKAFAHRKTFVWKTSFSAWMYRIATNRLTDYYRTKKSTEELNPERDDHQPTTSSHASKDFDEQLLGERLETILEQLPERERLVITMKFYNELSHEEIGEILHLQANHVGVIVHRALKKCQNVASEPLTGMLYEHLS